MKTRPYIGVSGVMSAAEAEAVLGLYVDAWDAVGMEPTHDLMVGVLASQKTLAGGTNRYPLRYPKREDIAACFIDHPLALNLVHYASDTPPDVDALFLLDELSGPRCHGFQFNVSWPQRIDLANFHGHNGERRVVLQVGPKMLAEMSAGAIAEKLRPDHPRSHGNHGVALATDVLLDISGGRGIGSAPKERADLVPILDELSSLTWRWPLVVAGGLCAETLSGDFAEGPEGHLSWRDVLKRTSIDAEGRLRDAADGGGNLDMAKVRAYLRAAVVLASWDGKLPRPVPDDHRGEWT